MGLIVSNPEHDDVSPRHKSPRSPTGRIGRSKSDAALDIDTFSTRSRSYSRTQSEGLLISSQEESEDAQVNDMRKTRHRSFSKKQSNFPDFSKEGEKVPQLSLESPSLEKKLILLGTGDGGKSTWLKQCRALYQMFSVNELKAFKETVLSNLLDCVMLLVKAAEEQEIPIQNEKAVFSLKALMDSVCLYVSVSNSFTTEVVDDIKAILQDAAIKSVLDRKKEIQWYENGEYWLNSIDRVCDPDYVPTMQDVVRTKVKTVGMIETEKVVEISEELINTDNVPISLCDVGGQRCERRKWVHGFKNVSAVLYFVSLPEFNEKCYEDEATNRLTESLKVFEQIINNQGKAESLGVVKNYYLIFTKPDLFEQVITDPNTDMKLFDQTTVEGQTPPIKFLEHEKANDKVEQCRQVIARKFINVITDEKKRSELAERCFSVNCLQLKDVQYAMTQILKDVCFGKKDGVAEAL